MSIFHINPAVPQVEELRRLTLAEKDVLITAVQLLQSNGNSHKWACDALLENDAEFIRGLFWTSRQPAPASTRISQPTEQEDRNKEGNNVVA